jgi:hypothetical protein
VTTHTELINALSNEVKPVSPHAVSVNVAEAVIIGGLIAMICVITIFGIQPGLDTFAHGRPLLMKAAYAISLAGIAISMTMLLARPGAWSGQGVRWIIMPVLALGLLAMTELSRAPAHTWSHILMGSSWSRCPWRIAALSMPVFAGLCVAIRRQAPTDLRAAGAAAGLLSGAVAATLYALACAESSALFVLVWYSLGIAIATGIGALLGPRVLRW